MFEIVSYEGTMTSITVHLRFGTSTTVVPLTLLFADFPSLRDKIVAAQSEAIASAAALIPTIAGALAAATAALAATRARASSLSPIIDEVPDDTLRARLHDALEAALAA